MKAYDLGIDLIGFANPDCLKNYKDLLVEREKLNLSCSIEEKNLERRINPYLILEDVKTIISVAISYNVEFDFDKECKNCGIISKSAWGIDYHIVLKEKMDMLIEFIKFHCEDLKAVSLVDNNPLLERAIARSAGIGWFGKNNLIINDEYGSYIFLGEILINKFFVPDQPQDSKCGDCNLCLKACPTKALIEPYKINSNKCLSYATINKEILDKEIMIKMGRRLYGCDTCQQVCPYNQKARKVFHSEFIPRKLMPMYDINKILTMSNLEFDMVFGNTSASWRGKNIIIRNAVIICGNIKSKECINYLMDLLNSKSPVLRGYSFYSIIRIFGIQIYDEIKNFFFDEKDEKAKNIMNKALELLKGDEKDVNKRGNN